MSSLGYFPVRTNVEMASVEMAAMLPTDGSVTDEIKLSSGISVRMFCRLMEFNDDTRNILEDMGADTVHDLIFLLTNKDLLQLLKNKMLDSTEYIRLINKLNDIYMEMSMSDIDPELEAPSFTLLSELFALNGIHFFPLENLTLRIQEHLLKRKCLHPDRKFEYDCYLLYDIVNQDVADVLRSSLSRVVTIKCENAANIQVAQSYSWLRKSLFFMPLVTEKSLRKYTHKTQCFKKDVFLLSLQYALKITKNDEADEDYILPLLCGATVGDSLYRFKGYPGASPEFNYSKYISPDWTDTSFVGEIVTDIVNKTSFIAKYGTCCSVLLVIYVVALCVNSTALYNLKHGHHFRRWDELNITHNVSGNFHYDDAYYDDSYYDDSYYTPKEYREEKKTLISQVDSDFEMIWSILFYMIIGFSISYCISRSS